MTWIEDDEEDESTSVKQIIAETYREGIAHLKAQLDHLGYGTSQPWRPVPLHNDVPVRLHNVAGLYRAVLLLWRFDAARESKAFLLAHEYMWDIHHDLVRYVSGLLGKTSGEVESGSWEEEDLERERRVLTREWVRAMGMLTRSTLPRAFGHGA